MTIESVQPFKVSIALWISFGQHRPQPARVPPLGIPCSLLVGLLAVESLLFLFGRFRSALTDEKSGWAALIALASAAATLLILLFWFVITFVSRRRFQFGLRSLLALVAAIALLCNWLATDSRTAARQREAVVAIREDGGSRRRRTAAPTT